MVIIYMDVKIRPYIYMDVKIRPCESCIYMHDSHGRPLEAQGCPDPLTKMHAL